MNLQKWLVIALVAALGFGVAAYAEDVATEEGGAKAQSVKSFPFQGVVSGDRVNMRSGPGTKFDILRTLKLKDTVTVVGEKDGWYEIEIPESVALFVHEKYVKMEEGDAFPRKGEVTSPQLNVRPRPDTAQKEMGQVTRGAILNVVGKKGEYWQVASPAGVYAYVSVKYVKAGGPEAEKPATGVQSTADAAGLPNDAARKEFESVDVKYLEEINKDVKEWNFDAIEAEYKNMMTTTQDERVQQLVQTRLHMIDLRRQLQVQRAAAEQAQQNRKEELEGITAKYIELQDALKALQEANKPVEYLATGWVKSVGRYFGRPAAYRLEKGGVSDYFLDVPENASFKLTDYALEYVGVMGNVEERNGQKVVVVTEIKRLRSEK